MANEKIIDAVAEAPETRTTTVPVKIDTSALSQAMSKIAAAQIAAQAGQPGEQLNPADVLSGTAAAMTDLYARYDALRELGAFFQGKTFADPVPADVVIENVTIRFRPANSSDVKEAKVYSVACIGDIGQLISMEMGLIIATLQKETARVSDMLKMSTETLEKARAAWSASNKDRKIVDKSPADDSAAQQQ